MKVKAKEKEIIHVELVDKEKTESMIAIGVEKGGRIQYQCHGTAPALLSALTILAGHTVAGVTEDFGMTDSAKVGLLDTVCEKAKEVMKDKLAEGKKKEDDDDDDMPSDLKDALKSLKKLTDMLEELGEL